MRLFLYNIGIQLYAVAARIYGLFNSKAREWSLGVRKQSVLNFKAGQKTSKRIWFHISSLGEYEQAVPLLKNLSADHELVITFFSPSGYHVKKENPFTDQVFFLHLDTHLNAKKAFELVNPDLVVLVKYDYWYHLIQRASVLDIPVVVVSASFREQQVFFKSYGGFFRDMLSHISYWYTQNQVSEDLLNRLNYSNHMLCGDTRIDSVLSLKESVEIPKAISQFIDGGPCLVMGSCYTQEINILFEHLPQFENWKLILAPHQMGNEQIGFLQQKFPESTCLTDLLNGSTAKSKVLIVDTIGWLKHLYQVADLAFIGGGFGRTVHNTLEPAVYGIPLVFGPNYKKFNEAVEMVHRKGAFVVENSDDFGQLLPKLLKPDYRDESGEKNALFMAENSGASNKLLAHLRNHFT